jgi:enoyl-CoA hydratase/carnithine racemase
MAKGASVALKWAKRALHHGAGATMLQAIQYENFAQAHCAETFDHEEATKAFLEKREPRFQGK